MSARVIHGDCLQAMRRLAGEGVLVDSIVTDPPYGLGFMGKSWDKFESADMPMRRNAAMDAVNAGPSRQGGRQRACADYQLRQARDMRTYQAWCEEWAEAAFTLMKPGAHLVAFGGSRTFHRVACAIEDAGLEIRDTIMWLYGSGFPKSHDVSKGIDRTAGAEREVVGRSARCVGPSQIKDEPFRRGISLETQGLLTAPATDAARQWEGWGTALKPAHEPIILARKPLDGTVAANVLRHGTGAINIDGCRVETAENLNGGAYSGALRQRAEYTSADSVDGAVPLSRLNRGAGEYQQPAGRWPANVCHDGSPEVLEAFARFGEKTSGSGAKSNRHSSWWEGGALKPQASVSTGGDTGTAARFFPALGFSDDGLRFHYSSKAGKADRAGSAHPTVKPLSLMRWLCRLVTPPGGLILDPFAGSGTTLQAATEEGFRAIGIEQEAEYVADIERRLAKVQHDAGLFAA